MEVEEGATLRVAGSSCGVLGRLLAAHRPELLPDRPGVWRASVALVLRWTRPPPRTGPESPPLARGFLRENARHLELLFIQRSSRDGDPWSGHIGFPGGRRDDTDADDLSCAVRETHEELGLQLAREERYSLLGRLDDAAIPSSRAGRKGGILSSFVFLQTEPPDSGHDVLGQREPELSLDPAEVTAVLWVPVSALLAGSPARVGHVMNLKPRHLGFVGVLVPAPVLRVLGLHRVLHTAVDVYAACTEVVYADDDEEAELLKPSEADLHSVADSPVLWGLSLRAASDMIAIFGGNRIDRPAFVFDNRLLGILTHAFVFVARRLSAFRPKFRFGRRRT